MERIIIAATNLKNVIGKDNDLPWNLPLDLKRFKETTRGFPVIMGRKTYESTVARLKKPLPGRKNIVLSSTQTKSEFENVYYVKNMAEAISLAEEFNQEKVFFIGGADIFKKGLGYADKIMLTQVLGWQDGDTFFPYFNRSEWELEFSETHVQESGHSDDFMFIDLKRRT